MRKSALVAGCCVVALMLAGCGTISGALNGTARLVDRIFVS